MRLQQITEVVTHQGSVFHRTRTFAFGDFSLPTWTEHVQGFDVPVDTQQEEALEELWRLINGEENGS